MVLPKHHPALVSIEFIPGKAIIGTVGTVLPGSRSDTDNSDKIYKEKWKVKYCAQEIMS